MLDGNRRVLRIGDEVAGGSGVQAEAREDLEMIRTGADDASIRSIHDLSYECEHLARARRSGEDPTVRDDAD